MCRSADVHRNDTSRPEPEMSGAFFSYRYFLSKSLEVCDLICNFVSLKVEKISFRLTKSQLFKIEGKFVHVFELESLPSRSKREIKVAN